MRAPNIMTKYWKTNDKKPTYAAIVKDKKGKSITELKMSITTLAIIKIPITKYIHSKALYKYISSLFYLQTPGKSLYPFEYCSYPTT